MPVKIEAFRYSPTDCGTLSDIIDQSDFNFNDDDLWNNFIPTPPQSPQLKVECFDEICFEDVHYSKDVIKHDCMWSGECEQRSSHGYNKKLTRPDTPSFNHLSTSPQSTLNALIPSSYDLSINESLFTELLEPSCCISDNVFGMVNDHSSYAQNLESDNTNDIDNIINNNDITEEKPKKEKNDKSFHKKYSKRINSQNSKVTKMKLKKNTNRKANNNSILNPINDEDSSTSTNDNDNDIINNKGMKKINFGTNNKAKLENNNVAKPTIISVSSFKNFKEANFHGKYLSVKNKKLTYETLNDLKKMPSTSTTTISTINSNKVKILNQLNLQNSSSSSSNNNNFFIQTPMASPVGSDSEESSVSFSSGEPPIKRREHNDSERKRRDHLRNSFNNLRDAVPTLQAISKRPPRIMILHEATSYVKELISKNEELENELREQQEKKKRLMEILNGRKLKL